MACPARLKLQPLSVYQARICLVSDSKKKIPAALRPLQPAGVFFSRRKNTPAGSKKT